MNISAPFIRRPVATSLLAAALLLAGLAAFTQLPVAPLPRVDFPTIQVSAALPGASPETMASAVATPLERRFGRIAGLTEMTSTSSLGTTQHHAAVRSRPRRRPRPRATFRRPSTPRAASCPQPADAPELPQGQPRRLADPDPVADVRHAAAGAGVRRRQQHPGAEDLAGARAWGRSSWAAGSSPPCACRSTARAGAAWASASRTCAPRSRPRRRTSPRASIAGARQSVLARRQRPAARRRRLPAR